MDMVEKVARAICMSRHGGCPGDRKSMVSDSQGWRAHWGHQAFRDAESVIDAMIDEAVSPEEMRAFRERLSQSAASGEVIDAVVKGNALIGSLSK